ncbi:alpha/beta-hydrolase [Cryphonectria parasitica EP155]|uniref:Carboxylic ester hydrolase n=1 Tax=Cryphonectria parasitica (strain ATCC 38755 / EP155) TaxID=660469 RepID=A0A9P4XZE0_CRYP1|nr:alpha/beta-hydrolase [Cryphonectria parasitica EP155]KAF3764152.1 alpha/beta-hydrolase [Cryphonectria parasitica EP155]
MPLHDPVSIETGLVAGFPSEHKPSVTIFRGVPFAASTAGENRWRAPQPAEPWSGARDCTQFGPIAPQLPPGPLYWTEEHLQPRQSEDCLNLNLWTPAQPEDLGQAKYPVYVWIYGGKFLWGAGTDNNFDGTSLAAKGVIVITFNYRLGILGWLAHPALSAESGHNASGNYGLLDQIACLQWIQRNIKAFGGDPGRVTIGGQSAGSACVGLHLYGPESKGLFHGVISQSGTRHPRDPLISCLAPSYRTKDQAESEGEMILAEKGAKDISDMRAMSLEKLLEGNHRDDTTMWGPPPFYRACLDGWLFPRTYEDTLLQGTMNDVPLLNGQNADESGNYTHPDFNDQDLDEVARIKYGPLSERWFQLYGDDGEGTTATALDKWNAACRDNSRVGPHLHHELWARHAKSDIFIYFWTHAPPPRRGFRTDYPVPKAKGYVFFNGSRTGAYHAAEIPYVFDSLWTAPWDPYTDVDRGVADMASELWANFIKTGNPNGVKDGGNRHGAPQLAPWPTAAEDPDHVMEIGKEMRLIPNAKSKEREKFWKDYFAIQKVW